MSNEEDQWSQDCYDRLLNSRPDQLAIDSETTGLSWTDTAFGVSFAWYVSGQLCSGYIDIRYVPELWHNVKAWIKEDKPELILWNAKFDFHKLGLYPQADNFQDGCLMVYILNENHPKGLKALAAKVLKEETDESAAIKAWRKDNKARASDGYDTLPLALVVPYACKDAEYTLRLYHRLQDALEKEDDLQAVYSVEKELLLCVAGMERRGIGLDIPYLKQRIIELGDEILALEREISGIVGRPIGDGKKKIRVPDGKYKNGNPKFRVETANEFNPNSPVQVTNYFASIGVILQGTDENALEQLSNPLAAALVRMRKARKIRNTYLVPILEESVDGIAHPNLNIMGTRTKRFSSSGASDG